MRGLLKKDLILCRYEFMASIIIMTAVILISIIGKLFFLDSIKKCEEIMLLPIIFGIITEPLLVAQTLFHDDKCGHMKYALAAPINRKEYVKEKYLLSLFFIVLFALFEILIIFIVKGIDFELIVEDTSISINKYLSLKELFLIEGLIILMQIHVSTFIISISVKKSFNVSVALLVLYSFLGFFVLSFLLGFFTGLSEASGEPGFKTGFYIFLAVFFFLTWLRYFIKSFIWAEKREF